MKAVDVHHHYVPQPLIEEAKRHGKVLGVDVSAVSGSDALSFAGSKPHRLQPQLMDIDKRIEVMDRGQIAVATLEANTNSLGYRFNGEQGRVGAISTTTASMNWSRRVPTDSSAWRWCRCKTVRARRKYWSTPSSI
jgi:hypothetical protein